MLEEEHHVRNFRKNLLNKHNTIDNKTYYLPTPII